MKFPKKTIFNARSAMHLFTLTMLVAVMSLAISAQKTISNTSKAILAEAATLEQCRNGQTATDPRSGCRVIGGNLGWVTGNAGGSNSNWAETQFLSYRMLFSDLTPGVQSTVTIGYDIFHQGVHAIDYLGTYNATETNANPCVNVSGTHCGGGLPNTNPPAPTSTFPITVDTNFVTVGPDGILGTPDDITQIPGVFTMWGGTISGMTYNAWDGTDERTVTITFTPSPGITNPVLAWSGHVAWRGEWGAGNSAGGISGSPYHMRLKDLNGSGGNQDRSLSADAVLVPALVEICKQTYFADSPTNVNLNFLFQSTGIDFDGDLNDFFFLNTATDLLDCTGEIAVTTNLLSGDPAFAVGEAPPTNWSLAGPIDNPAGMVCSETGQLGFTPVINSTLSYDFYNGGPLLGAGTANIKADEGEDIRCTFTNVYSGPTAAPASISGRVATADGTAIANARMTLMNASTGEVHSALTNAFGYYTFEGMSVSELYVLSVSHKRYSFADGERAFTLNEDLQGVDFIAN